MTSETDTETCGERDVVETREKHEGSEQSQHRKSGASGGRVGYYMNVAEQQCRDGERLDAVLQTGPRHPVGVHEPDPHRPPTDAARQPTKRLAVRNTRAAVAAAASACATKLNNRRPSGVPLTRARKTRSTSHKGW